MAHGVTYRRMLMIRNNLRTLVILGTYGMLGLVLLLGSVATTVVLEIPSPLCIPIFAGAVYIQVEYGA